MTDNDFKFAIFRIHLILTMHLIYKVAYMIPSKIPVSANLNKIPYKLLARP